MTHRSLIVSTLLFVAALALAGTSAWSQARVALPLPTWLPTLALRGEVVPLRKPQLPKPDHIYGGNQPSSAPSDTRSELHVIVISDLNGRYGSTSYAADVHAAVQEIIARRPDLVLSTGDMVAGQREGLDYRAMWQAFHAAVTVPLRDAGIPLLITPGNHDGATSARFAHERAIFSDEWELYRPKVQLVDDAFYPVRYSAVVGQTFFISLDATAVGPLPREQMIWLERQLAQSQGYDNRIVFGHVPLWAVTIPKRREVIGDSDLEALFERYRVSAYISGHHHAYYPGARGDLRLIAMPCLGSGLRALIAPLQERAPKGFVEFVAAPGGLYDVEAWRAPRFHEVIDRESLPPKVGLGRGVMVRDDLLGLDLRARPVDDKECASDRERCASGPSPRSYPALPDGLGR